MRSPAHPAFDKAAHLLGLEVVRTPLGPDFQADTDAMAGSVSARTIMIVGSAPCFPYGLIDPIADLSALAGCYAGANADLMLNALDLQPDQGPCDELWREYQGGLPVPVGRPCPALA